MRHFSKRKKSICFSILLLIVCATSLLNSTKFAVHAANTTSITLSILSGPPTATVQVNGLGFGIQETVTIQFDSTPSKTTTTDGGGTFATSITVPASALPSNHTVQAMGQITGLSAQASFLVSTDWQQPGFDSAHTGLNPYENVLTTANVYKLTSAWSYKVINVHYAAIPAVANGLVYISTSNDQLIALNASTGTLVWSITNTGYLYMAPLVANGVLYASSYDGNLYAFNAQTGASLWNVPISTTTPVLANGILYLGSDKLYALDAATGILLWSYSSGTLRFSSPVVSDDVVYVGASDGMLDALSITTRTLLWSTAGWGAFTVAGGNVYIGYGNFIYALKAKDGSLKWRYGTNEGINNAVATDNVVYANTNHRVVALDPQKGKVLWIFYKGQYNDRFVRPSQASPVLANGVIYVDYKNAGKDTLYAIDAAVGFRLWSSVKRDLQAGYPIIVNGWLYVGTNTVDAYHLPGTLS